jgi:PAS domain S-box-containing protein
VGEDESGRRRAKTAKPGPPSPALLVAALDQVADGILLVDAGGVIVYVSGQVGELFGYDPGELVGRKVEVLVPSGARPMHRRFRKVYNGEPHVRNMGTGLPLEGVRKDGTRLALDIRLGPLEGSDLIVASVRDVSAHRRAEADLATERAERAVVAERERIGRALHDLVIQRLFGIAATLVGLSNGADERTSERLSACIDYIDDTIEAIRDSVLADPGAGDGVAQLPPHLTGGRPHMNGRAERNGAAPSGPGTERAEEAALA